MVRKAAEAVGFAFVLCGMLVCGFVMGVHCGVDVCGVREWCMCVCVCHFFQGFLHLF